MSADMIDVSLRLRVPARMTMADLRSMLERIANSEGMNFDIKGGWPLYAELTAKETPIAQHKIVWCGGTAVYMPRSEGSTS